SSASPSRRTSSSSKTLTMVPLPSPSQSPMDTVTPMPWSGPKSSIEQIRPEVPAGYVISPPSGISPVIGTNVLIRSPTRKPRHSGIWFFIQPSLGRWGSERPHQPRHLQRRIEVPLGGVDVLVSGDPLDVLQAAAE